MNVATIHIWELYNLIMIPHRWSVKFKHSHKQHPGYCVHIATWTDMHKDVMYTSYFDTHPWLGSTLWCQSTETLPSIGTHWLLVYFKLSSEIVFFYPLC